VDTTGDGAYNYQAALTNLDDWSTSVWDVAESFVHQLGDGYADGNTVEVSIPIAALDESTSGVAPLWWTVSG
jgi:hypothetical protein